MTPQEQMIYEIGEFLDFSMNRDLAEWLEDAGLDSPADDAWFNRVLAHIKNLQVKDIK